MTSLEIIKDELARIEKDEDYILAGRQGNMIKDLSKALSVAVETLQTMNHLEVQFKAQGGVYNPKLGCVKHETIWDVTTKPSEDVLKTIANILSGGKDGK